VRRQLRVRSPTVREGQTVILALAYARASDITQVMTVEETLAELVAIDSVSSRSNTDIISYLEARCQARGLTCKRLSHIDDQGVIKLNLVAQTHVDANVELALVGHTDTVPYDPAWSEALRLTEESGKLFGRGSCDTKAFIAAALTAIDGLDPKELKKPLALIFTADEEIGCLGAKRLADARPFNVRYAIVGEPTSLQPIRAGKGYGLAEITLHGREAHSAYPQLGASAILRAAHLLAQIERIAEGLKSDQRAGFDPPFTTLNVGLIKGGSAKNVVAGECRLTLEWRPIPGQQTDHVLQLLQQAVEELRRNDSDFVCEIDAARADDSFETRANSPLVEFLEQASGNTPGTVAFGTEAPSMIALGADAVVFGPGDIRVAHRTGEFVPVDQLNKCVGILRDAIEKFCC
jgi:acetylornithine deacetylase